MFISNINFMKNKIIYLVPGFNCFAMALQRAMMISHQRTSWCSFCVRRWSAGNDNEAAGTKIKNQFGFKKIKSEEKQAQVNAVFHNVANKYDIMNDVMSLGSHRIWKDKFVELLAPCTGTKLIDVAGGTGDISFRFLKHLRAALPQNQSSLEPDCVTVCDINPAMLEVGKERAKKVADSECMRWVVGNAEKLPFEADAFSAYTIAFGIRNVTDINKALSEAYRVLQPGGRFLCLEFSQVTDQRLKTIYDKYSFEVIPVLGYLIAGQWQSYQYLVESIRNFPDQDTFQKMIEAAGFRSVSYTNLTYGVVAVHSAFKL